MIEINLIPDVKQELIRARMVRSAVVTISIFVAVAFAAAVVVLCLYVFGAQALRNTLADNQIKDGSNKLAKVDDLSKILTIQNQLTKINSLNDDKKIDSRTFMLLQAVIPPAPNNVQISKLTIDADTDTISFEGQTLLYPSVETFKKTIAAANVRYKDADNKQTDVPLASDLSISDVSYGDDVNGNKVIRFTMSFTYAQEFFSPTIDSPSIVLIDGGNVTDSYVGVPKSIFVDRASDTGASQ